MNFLSLFFVIDHSHSQKRILAFKNNIKKLTIISYFRNQTVEYENHYNLGKIPQNNYIRRFVKIFFDIPRLSKILSNNPKIDVVYAWNFDIALLFVLTKLFSKRRYKFIYEVADVKPILLSKSVVGIFLRKFEQFILNHTDYLCVTSENFISNYFDKYYEYDAKTYILENKVYPKIDIKLINNKLNNIPTGSKWRIGLVGIFRCNTSLQLLLELAKTLPEKIEIILAGKPEEHVNESFKELTRLNDTLVIGEYRYPNDLQNIYSKIDIIWSADFSEPTVNSKWLLPNRIYEAGLFTVPQLCFSENKAISNYIKSLNIGWILEEVNIKSLMDFFSSLTNEQYHQMKLNYSNLPSDLFSGDEQVKSLLSKVRLELLD
ncbi:MAG: hypothetical protein GWP19_08985 [Planctomycetia bacterium]|nr:hypothetical protein [Planctomycetia bacterium]